MSSTNAQLCACPLSILTCVLFTAAIAGGLNIVREIKLGFFVVLLSWCWISAVSRPLHLHFLQGAECHSSVWYTQLSCRGREGRSSR